MRVRNALFVGAAAVLLALMVPMGTANAATGSFEYATQPDNVPHLLNNPRDGQCYNIRGDGFAANITDRDVELYAGANCRGDIVNVLTPEQEDPDVAFGSVKFIR
ncbi:hypothetical protein [Kitasatospora sp. NPDC001175]|uniref:hypothetical protein n=1 Tax=Kitasatospora sp. NPDC001175 TaxID=3157103 RepID=UPI003D07EEB2